MLSDLHFHLECFLFQMNPAHNFQSSVFELDTNCYCCCVLFLNESVEQVIEDLILKICHLSSPRFKITTTNAQTDSQSKSMIGTFFFFNQSKKIHSIVSKVLAFVCFFIVNNKQIKTILSIILYTVYNVYSIIYILKKNS